MSEVEEPGWLNENHVVDYVAVALDRAGWKIEVMATTSERGPDVVASRGGRRLRVEAKGETSSKDDSNRTGELFSSSQRFISLAAAMLKTAQMMHAYDDDDLAVMAVPDSPGFRKLIASIEPFLKRAGLGVLWVERTAKVTAWNTNVLDAEH